MHKEHMPRFKTRVGASPASVAAKSVTNIKYPKTRQSGASEKSMDKSGLPLDIQIIK
jgi:hypothetical protein